MANVQLYQWLKDNGITVREAAERTGYHYNYLVGVLNGTESLSRSVRFAFIAAYPETAKFLMPHNGNGDHHDDQEPAE